MVHEIEDFYGVYLLFCLNPKYKGRTYIGYTVDPNRRIKQHNAGSQAGGACRTSGRGPWEMVLIIHGFPNDISGLRFEWAWQHPDKSRRLRDVPAKTRKETVFQYRWRVVCNMLRTAPWCGLCLTVRWLKQDFQMDFLSGLEPPLHMPVVFGPVVRKQLKNKSSENKSKADNGSESSSQKQGATSSHSLTFLQAAHQLDCAVCCKQLQIEDKTLSCLNPSCQMTAHIICLAKSFLSDLCQLLPVEGNCPHCQINLLWGELVRYKKGCNRNLSKSAFQVTNESCEGEDRLTDTDD